MSTIVSLRIETWGDKFVVVGEFTSHIEIPRQEFTSYLDALNELAKIAKREEVRNETRYGRGSHW